MKKTTRLAAALCATALFTPLSHAQNLYVGSNSSGVTTNFTSGTNSFTDTYVGFSSSANSNTLLVENSTTLLTNSGVIAVGYEGSGNSLVVSNGGTVAVGVTSYIGFSNTSANNSALVTGTNSRWDSTNLNVGYYGSGNTLAISNGGTVAAEFFVVGYNPNSSANSALITGDASSLVVNDELRVSYDDNTGNSMTIADGGSVSSYVGFIGSLSADSSNNSVLVTGANSRWDNSNDLYVGETGHDNSLVISNGGTVAVTNNSYIGFTNTSSNNSALVTGAGSAWTNSNELVVGSYGSGNSLVVSNGGSVWGFNGSLGIDAASSNNSALVTGTNSLWANTNGLFIGFRGSGNSLIISNGGTVAVNSNGTVASGSSIGFHASSSDNSVLVTGTNSRWTDGGDLNIGWDGSGNSLVISNGGTVTANLFAVGLYTNSSDNNVLVTGDGSSLVVNDELRVSYDDNTGNSMTIADGGSVSSVGGFIGSLSADSSNNSVLVTGANSRWDNGLNFFVGEEGHDNSLVISNGGTVAVAGDSFIGFSVTNTTSSNNSVLVTGAGSRWTTVDELRVGENGGGNSLVVANGGTVVNALGSLGAASASNSALVTGAGSAWTNTGDFYVGNAGSGNSLSISDGGRVAAGVGYIGYDHTGSNNSALVTGAGSTWTNNGDLVVGRYGIGHSLTISDGGTAAASGLVVIASQAGSSGILNIGCFGTNDSAGTINTTNIAFGAGTGTINFNQSNSATISAAISGNGSVNQLGSGKTTLSASNTYTGATTVGGGLLVVNGSIANSTVTVQSGGTLGGSGTVGAVTIQSGGTINPGNSPGTLNINGDIDWLGGGNYNWQIAGVTGASGTVSTWDLISATGILDLSALSIDSKFNINLWSLSSTSPADVNGAVPGFNNTQNYTWKIATATGGITNFNSSYFNFNTGAINGTAGFANGLNGGTFSLLASGNDLNLVFTAATGPAAVPEPGTWAAAALLAGGAAFMRWRKRAKVA